MTINMHIVVHVIIIIILFIIPDMNDEQKLEVVNNLKKLKAVKE